MNRVLIVEQERDFRRLLFAELVENGYSVAEATSVAGADDALAVWEDSFDLLVLDINLPDGSGWDVLRHRARQVPTTSLAGHDAVAAPKVVILATARPAQCRLDEFHPAAVLLKPFPIQALLRLIGRLLTGTPAEMESGETGEIDVPTLSPVGPPA